MSLHVNDSSTKELLRKGKTKMYLKYFRQMVSGCGGILKYIEGDLVVMIW